MHWILASSLSAIFGTIYIMCFAHVSKHLSSVLPYLLFILYSIAAMWCATMLGVTGSWVATVSSLSLLHYVLLLVASTAFVLSTYFFAKGFVHASDPSYVVAVANCNVLLVLFVSLLYRYITQGHVNSLHPSAIVGVILVGVGLVLLSKYS